MPKALFTSSQLCLGPTDSIGIRFDIIFGWIPGMFRLEGFFPRFDRHLDVV